MDGMSQAKETSNLMYIGNEKLLKDFQVHLENQGASLKTQKDYLNDVKNYLNWLWEKKVYSPDEITFITINKFRDERLEKTSPATVNRNLTALRKFYDCLGKPELVSRVKLKFVEEVKPAPKSLTLEEWDLLDRVAERQADKDKFLSISILRIMRYAGLRVGEVCSLDLPDLECNTRRGNVRILRGKGLKARDVPLSKEVCEVLSLYLEHRKLLAERWERKSLLMGKPSDEHTRWPNGRVFLSQRGGFTANGLYRLVNHIGSLAKIKKIHPHVLRHTFAKSLVDPKRYGLRQDAAPLSAIKQLMGHASIQTTGIYLLHSEEDLERIINGK
ncbi:tyrosine-type recombinase/integrase [Fluviispira sanaruensis]|uniref:Integrase n=1 Tax=Fluviispira sanaruensis TaxID=2493639 RepID=A0A4P2VRC0_FLUSA|nr:tyrosine-type recombinase/integrase [Fluviispira sanaruensis]BBH54749.1 integrase [Fluviispira sanaruensis]